MYFWIENQEMQSIFKYPEVYPSGYFSHIYSMHSWNFPILFFRSPA